jgi:hypothetical protein
MLLDLTVRALMPVAPFLLCSRVYFPRPLELKHTYLVIETSGCFACGEAGGETLQPMAYKNTQPSPFAIHLPARYSRNCIEMALTVQYL